jgi:hypothetical protein
MANTHVPVTGGCLCGAVRYESKTAPTEGFYCHCRSCQKFFGGLFGPYVRMARASLAFTTGTPTYYRSSDVARRGFCATCGSPMVFIFDNVGADYWISVGSLDHPEDWPLTRSATWGPVVHGCVDNKIAWQDIADGLPQRTSDNALLRQEAEAALGRDLR